MFSRLSAINELRNTLRNGRVSIGAWMQIPHSSVAEILGASGYDWLAVDLEHGAFSLHQLPDIFRAIELGGTLPIARLSEGSKTECKQVLDAGAGGVIVPMIETADQLISVRNACRWPPAGERGVGFSRANLFGKNFDRYQEEAQSPLLVAMIENAEALNNIESILSVSGLDALLVGPYDLSASLGCIANFQHPDFLNALNKISNACRSAKIAMGVHIVEPSKEELRKKIDLGYQFIAYSIDAVILNRFSNLDELKNL